MSQFCQYEDHDESPIIGACLKIDCKYSSSYCYHCIIKHHNQHMDDLKTFKQLNEWIKIQMNTYQDLKTFNNEIIQLSERLSKFLITINVDQQLDYSQLSQEVMKDQINKLIRISISKISLIPLISKLYEDLSNLKVEINKINQNNIKSNTSQNINYIQSLEQDKQEINKIKIVIQEKDQEIKQYIIQIQQQQHQIQSQKVEINQKNEQINQLKQENEQLKYLIKTDKQIYQVQLKNLQIDQQIQFISQQSQQDQYYQSQRQQHTQFLQNQDSQYQNVSFQFIQTENITVANGGKKASGFGWTGQLAFCEPSIPLNQNVKLAFRIIRLGMQIDIGIGSMNQSEELNINNSYSIDSLLFKLYENDTVLLDIRMKDKKLIFKNLRSLKEQQMSIDTSQVLYPYACFRSSSIEIVDNY